MEVAIKLNPMPSKKNSFRHRRQQIPGWPQSYAAQGIDELRRIILR
jgi:hypothetical protein